jgi:hypothetical protein
VLCPNATTSCSGRLRSQRLNSLTRRRISSTLSRRPNSLRALGSSRRSAVDVPHHAQYASSSICRCQVGHKYSTCALHFTRKPSPHRLRSLQIV